MESNLAIRKLAAIVVADVVGFSRHMERDDAGTLARLRGIREQLIDPRITKYNGHVVKTAGDGMLLEFGSADAALRCAVAVQRAMAARNEPHATDDRIEFRIGINLGDIIVDGNDIAGDGVNVAARLEALAEPGGICVSGAVRDQVHGSLDVGFVDKGEQLVKNITRPIRVFAVALQPAADRQSAIGQPDGARSRAAPVPSTARRRWPLNDRTAFIAVAGVMVLVVAGSSLLWWNSRSSAPLAPPAMSVGVMPLVAPSGDAAIVRRAEAWSRDLTSMLVRNDPAIRAVPALVAQTQAVGAGGINAVARALDVRYVLEGDVRHREDATLIVLRLINGATGEQVSSETVSLKETDTTRDQMRALRAAVQHLRDSLSDVEVRRVMALPPGDAMALDYVLRARGLWRTEPDTLQRAREEQRLYEEALRRDPNLVPALLGLNLALEKQIDNDVHVERDGVVRRMDELTSRAVNLNGTSPGTWAGRAQALMYMGQWDASLEASATSIRLDPEASGLISFRAWLMILSGRPAEALALAEQAIAMDPFGGWVGMLSQCAAHLLLGQYEQAIAPSEKFRGLSVEDWFFNLFLAAAHAHSGDTAKAAAAKAEVLRRVPGYTIATLKSKGYSLNPDYIRLAEEHLYSGLRKAGFPEN
jgi:class 3 adenylate cyclase/TolB-like protein